MEWLAQVRVLKAVAVRGYCGTSLPRYDRADGLAWTASEAPGLVLFISHRWASRESPDPQGASLRGIQVLLEAVHRVACGIDPACEVPMPDLREPWMLHGLVLYLRLLDQMDTVEGPGALDRLAVFFDYSCVPQGDDPAARQGQLDGLAAFPDMIPDARVALVALRCADDAYEERAWCVAESSLAMTYAEDHPWADTFPLRLALDQSPAPPDYPPLREALDGFAAQAAGRIQIVERDFRACLALVEHCLKWHNADREAAGAFIHHTGMLAKRSFDIWLDTMLLLPFKGEEGMVDLAAYLPEASERLGLVCSEARDRVPTMLMILAGLRWEELNRGRESTPNGAQVPEQDVFVQALQRYRRGEHLCVHARTRSGRMPLLTFVSD